VEIDDELLNLNINNSKMKLVKNQKYSFEDFQLMFENKDFPNFFKINLENNLAYQLGFEPNSNIFDQLSTQTGINLNFGIPSQMLIYVDFIESQIISDVYANVIKIVRTIEQNDHFGDLCQRESTNLNYFPVSKNNISEIKVELRDFTGNFMPFKFGVSSLLMHFRSKK
jgi:hypothetical protein